MQQSHQGFLAVGLIIILVALAVPNFKAFALGSINIVRPPYEHPKINKSRLKPYFAWVIGLTILCGLYNLAITRNLKLLGQITGLEAFFLAMGLVAVILYKKDDPHK